MTIYKTNVSDQEYKNTLYIQKVKFKYWGSPGQVDYSWDSETGRYNEFGRDLTNWIQPIQKQELISFGEARHQLEPPPF